MINVEQKFTPVRAVWWHCWTGAVMNILNYFWWTTFWLKDTFDVETLIQFWHFDWNERPSEAEICYFLCQMNFKIEEFIKIENWDREFYFKNPKEHQKKHWYISYPLLDLNRVFEKSKLLHNHRNYFLEENLDLDIEKIIKKYDDSKHLFLFWLDYNVLYWTNFEHWWHLVISTWFDKKTWKIILAETSPFWEFIYKDFEEVRKAMSSVSWFESVFVISLND